MGTFSRRLQQSIFADLSCYDSSNAIETMSVPQFAADSLRRNFLKKFVDEEDPAAEKRALDKFLQVNSNCKNFKLECPDVVTEELVGTLKDVIYKFLLDDGCPTLSYGEILSRASLGSGMNIMAGGSDFYTKLFSSRLTATRCSLYDVAKRHVAHLPSWRWAETIRSIAYGDCVIVDGNRLSFVPKTNETRRTICTEPTVNMYYQLGLGDWLHERLKRKFNINFDSQPDVNRELAKIGSVTDDYFTVDLSSASDSLSLGMIREIFPRDFVAWLELLRSPVTHLPDGRVVTLEMVSTMGNGYTFPLQTLLFSACVIACYRFHGIKYVMPGSFSGYTFSVFGDDIIAHREIYATLCHLLRTLGFTINYDKSFFQGPFRESCGHDYFHGHDVRPVFLKDVSTPQARCIAFNRLNEWSAKTGIRLRQSIALLLRSIPPSRYVPMWEQSDAGLRVPYALAAGQPWSKRYQSLVYRRWVPDPPRLRFAPDAVLRAPRGHKKRIYNPFGLMICLLRGDIISGALTLREEKRGLATRYRTRLGIAPNWDYGTSNSAMFHSSSSAQKPYSSSTVGWKQLRAATMSNMPLLNQEV